MGKLGFWIVVIALIVLAVKFDWFAPVANFFDNVKADIEKQQNIVPDEEEINDHGILTVEKGESRVVRRSALGRVMK